MNKPFVSMLAAGAAAFVMSSAAIGADQSQDPQADPARQSPAAKSGEGNAGAQPDVMKEKDAYFAALTKCDALKGVAEKQQCVDAVRKQYGQM
jgi:hypothetical protein